MMSPITHDDQVTLEALVWGGGLGTVSKAGHGLEGPVIQDSPALTGHQTTTGNPVHQCQGARVASRVYANDQQFMQRSELEETQTRERATCPAGHWQLNVPGSEGTGTRQAH